MDVATFFSRLLQPPKEVFRIKQPDDLQDFDEAWIAIKEILEYPNERQIIKGIASTDVPGHLRHIVDALVYEANRTDEDTTGACLEYFFKNDILAQLERLCENDRPHGIKVEVVKVFNNLVVLLSERFLVHNAVHRPLRRLLKSCIGDDLEEDKVDGKSRIFGAASAARSMEDSDEEDELEGDLVDLMCVLCSRMRAYPPLLLIFFHDKGWLQPHPSSGAPIDKSPSRAKSPPLSADDSYTSSSVQEPDQQAHHFEFLVFSYLLRFAHREGRVGDLARAGLLFLFDIAFLTQAEEGGENLHSEGLRSGEDPLQDARDALGEFILDGDFADVMAAGIGAIYSILPSKLKIPSLAAQAQQSEEGMVASTSGGMHLGATIDGQELAADELALVNIIEARNNIDMLLKLFGFLQDIIYRCNSPVLHGEPNDSDVQAAHVLGSAIAEATLDAIRAAFFENVLYPSILECSPTDSSSVAVMTYLEILFSNLDDGPLLQGMISFLMETGDGNRKASKGIEASASPYMDYFADEGRFTLKDLIIDNVNSSNESAATAALRLFQTLMSDHCRLSVKGLLTPARDPVATALARRAIPASTSAESNLVTEESSILPSPVNSTDVHLQEVELYGSLISRIDPLQTSTELTSGYAGYLTDMHNAIEADHCFILARPPLDFSEDGEKMALHIGSFDSDPFQHRMSPSDPLVSAILSSFGQFFCQSPDENVALTGALTTLTLCPHRSLAGWLLYDHQNNFDPWSKAQNLERDDASDLSFDDAEVLKKADLSDPFVPRAQVDLPAIYQVLRDLVRQVNRFRLDIDDFDRLLSERRQGLLFADHLDEAMNVMLDVEPSAFGLPATTQPAISTPTPKRPVKPSGGGLVGGLRSFLTPKRKSPSPRPTLGNSVGTPTTLREAASQVGSSSPFKSHYEQTSFLTLEASASSPIASGPWSPRKIPRLPQNEPRPKSSLSQGETASTLSSDQGRLTEMSLVVEAIKEQGPTKVTLSSVLDNCVILEEFLKETVAVITARRALGIDQVGFM